MSLIVESGKRHILYYKKNGVLVAKVFKSLPEAIAFAKKNSKTKSFRKRKGKKVVVKKHKRVLN